MLTVIITSYAEEKLPKTLGEECCAALVWFKMFSSPGSSSPPNVSNCWITQPIALHFQRLTARPLLNTKSAESELVCLVARTGQVWLTRMYLETSPQHASLIKDHSWGLWGLWLYLARWRHFWNSTLTVTDVISQVHMYTIINKNTHWGTAHIEHAKCREVSVYGGWKGT